MKEFVIYDNYNLGNEENYQEAIDSILDNIFDGKDSAILTDNYGVEVEVSREQYRKTISDNAIWEEINSMDSLWIEEIEHTLSHCDNGNGIIAFTNIGTWQGVREGYKEYDNLQDIIYGNDDYMRLYLNGNYDLYKYSSHHDGNNRVLYRYWKENLTDTQRENFLGKLYQGKATKKDISRYTRKIGVEIANYYGFIKEA